MKIKEIRLKDNVRQANLYNRKAGNRNILKSTVIFVVVMVLCVLAETMSYGNSPKIVAFGLAYGFFLASIPVFWAGCIRQRVLAYINKSISCYDGFIINDATLRWSHEGAKSYGFYISIHGFGTACFIVPKDIAEKLYAMFYGKSCKSLYISSEEFDKFQLVV